MGGDDLGRYDLLGDPIPENWGRRGRPAHIPTAENRNKIRVLLAFGWTDTRIAQALRVTRPTLKKHYFRELRHREEARPALEAQRLMLVYQAALAGNVGAMKELGRLIDHDLLARPPARESDADAPADPPEKLGKKAAATRDAATAHEKTGWETLVH